LVPVKNARIGAGFSGREQIERCTGRRTPHLAKAMVAAAQRITRRKGLQRALFSANLWMWGHADSP
jgi:hypothetical protein